MRITSVRVKRRIEIQDLPEQFNCFKPYLTLADMDPVLGNDNGLADTEVEKEMAVEVCQANRQDCIILKQILNQYEDNLAQPLPEEYIFGLAKSVAGLAKLQKFLREGTFMQFYIAARALAQSPLSEADAIIKDMTNSSESWERELGAILLQARNKTMRWLDPGNFQTGFFRNPIILSELKKDFAASHSEKFMVWDIGCSTGLSTESTRVVLAGEKKVKVLGTDINPFALLYAQRGKYLLEDRSHASHYSASQYHDNELGAFEEYLAFYDKEASAEKILRRYFEKVEVDGRTLYLAKRNDEEISFAFDNVATVSSVVSDNSMDAIVYSNVHYLLDPSERRMAVEKIYKKLKPGGKVYISDVNKEETPAEFRATFGSPVFDQWGVWVFVKR